MKFTDKNGIEWLPKITTKTVMKFEQSTGINVLAGTIKLMKLFKDINTIAPENSSMFMAEAMTNLLGNMTNLFKIIYFACEEQAEKKGITFEDFCELITGENVALPTMEILINFFQTAMAAFGMNQVEKAIPEKVTGQ